MDETQLTTLFSALAAILTALLGIFGSYVNAKDTLRTRVAQVEAKMGRDKATLLRACGGKE
jgi:hypothetical protein